MGKTEREGERELLLRGGAVRGFHLETPPILRTRPVCKIGVTPPSLLGLWADEGTSSSSKYYLLLLGSGRVSPPQDPIYFKNAKWYGNRKIPRWG